MLVDLNGGYYTSDRCILKILHKLHNLIYRFAEHYMILCNELYVFTVVTFHVRDFTITTILSIHTFLEKHSFPDIPFSRCFLLFFYNIICWWFICSILMLMRFWSKLNTTLPISAFYLSQKKHIKNFRYSLAIK